MSDKRACVLVRENWRGDFTKGSVYILWHVFKYSAQILSVSLKPGYVVFRTFAPLDLLPSCFITNPWNCLVPIMLLNFSFFFGSNPYICTYISFWIQSSVFGFVAGNKFYLLLMYFFLCYFLLKILKDFAVHNIWFMSRFSYVMVVYNVRLCCYLRIFRVCTHMCYVNKTATLLWASFLIWNE